MSSQDHPGNDHDRIPNIWMYVGIVTVSLASFYLTLLLTKLYY